MDEEEDDAEFTYPEDKRRLSGTASAAGGTSQARFCVRECVRALTDST